jgi:nitrite reductase/ring-hydroxylating ferredoxin subunit
VNPLPNTDVCAASDVIDGKAKVVPLRTDGTPVEVIVVREGDGVYGYVNECKHMAVPLNLLDDFGVQTSKHRMHCDHHYATFRFNDGYCIEGPCEGESLTPVPLVVRGGRVVVGVTPQT